MVIDPVTDVTHGDADADGDGVGVGTTDDVGEGVGQPPPAGLKSYSTDGPPAAAPSVTTT